MTAYRIGIAGAGIGGLALAALLADQGHHPEIFERFERAKPVGSGLVIQPVGQEILAQIGCLETLRASGAKITRMLGREATTGRRVLDVSYDPKQTGESFGLSVQRALIFDALFKAVQARNIPIHTGAEIRGHKDGTFQLANSSQTDRFDLLVDASGANSNLSPLVARALPFGALWATVNWVETPGFDAAQLSQKYHHARNMVGLMKTGLMPGHDKDTAAFFWSLPAGSYDDWQRAGMARWREDVLRLWPETAPFVEQIQDPEQLVMARYSHGTLRKPYDKGIAYIGDAAHRASPQLGQGANMALLDGAALAQAITRFGPKDAPKAYAKARRLHVAIYQAMSWGFTPMYQSSSRVLPFLRNNLLFSVSQMPPVPRILTCLVCGNLTPPVRRLGQTTPSARVSQSR